MGYDEEYGGITDRNYKLSRKGEDLKTTYSAIPMDKKPMNKRMLQAKKEHKGKLVTVLEDALD